MSLLYIFLLVANIKSEDVNIDSLLSQENNSILEGSTYRLISCWQSISYKSSKLNCQFYPSCSNYYALATNNFGVLGGSIRAADRFIRCNPAAVGYHLQNPNSEFHIDGRLVDKFELRATAHQKNINPSILFSAIPGFGRAYYGYKFDGFVSLTYVSGFSYLSYNAFKRKNEVMGILSSVIALLFWSADIFATNQLSLD